MTKELTRRGFRIYGTVTDSHGDRWRVQESSEAFQGAHVWIFWDSGTDPRDTVRPHLTVGQAKELCSLLGTFIAEAEAGELTEPAEPGGPSL